MADHLRPPRITGQPISQGGEKWGCPEQPSAQIADAIYPDLGVLRRCKFMFASSRMHRLAYASLHCMNRTAERLPENQSAADLHRATVCLWSDSIEEKVDFTAWLTAWKRRMAFVSHDYGCGCRIHLFDLEGPKEAIDALPQGLLMVSAWTEHGIKPAPPLHPSTVIAVERRAG